MKKNKWKWIFWKKKDKTGNIINVISPYRTEWGGWVFDDDDIGLVKEAFVGGADTFLTIVTENAIKCQVMFSAVPFPDYHYRLEKINPPNIVVVDIGNYYVCKEVNAQLWFCPALLKYFKTAPETIYAKIDFDKYGEKYNNKQHKSSPSQSPGGFYNEYWEDL